MKAVAVDLARAAGHLLRQHYGTAVNVTHKGSIDLVTDADKASEELILRGLKQRFPDDAILAEESGEQSAANDRRWVVDPLDGTVNFAHQIPHFSVLIALQHAGETVLGVVYDPMRDELYVAERGQGATLNGKPLAVSSATTLIGSLGCSGFAYDRLNGPHDNLREFALMNLVTQGVRRFGSAGLDLAYVAAGRYDFYWEYGLKPWDRLAAELLVTEAGGRVTDNVYILATNGHVHDACEAALQTSLQHEPNSREAAKAHLPETLAALINRP